MHHFVDSVYRNDRMKPEEKRDMIDKTYLQMIEIARQGNKVHDEMTRKR